MEPNKKLENMLAGIIKTMRKLDDFHTTGIEVLFIQCTALSVCCVLLGMKVFLNANSISIGIAGALGSIIICKDIYDYIKWRRSITRED